MRSAVLVLVLCAAVCLVSCKVPEVPKVFSVGIKMSVTYKNADDPKQPDITLSMFVDFDNTIVRNEVHEPNKTSTHLTTRSYKYSAPPDHAAICVKFNTSSEDMDVVRKQWTRPAEMYAGIQEHEGKQMHVWDSDKIPKEERAKLFGSEELAQVRDRFFTLVEDNSPAMRIVDNPYATAVSHFFDFKVNPKIDPALLTHPENVPCLEPEEYEKLHPQNAHDDHHGGDDEEYEDEEEYPEGSEVPDQRDGPHHPEGEEEEHDQEHDGEGEEGDEEGLPAEAFEENDSGEFDDQWEGEIEDDLGGNSVEEIAEMFSSGSSSGSDKKASKGKEDL